MTASGTAPDSWKEFCLIGIIPEAYPSAAGGGSEIAFAAMTEDITAMDWGDRDIESIATVSGGRIVKNMPMADESITMKMYPVDALLDTANVASGVAQLFHPQAAEDTTQPILVANVKDRRRFGVIILWASTLPSTAGTATAASVPAYRVQVVNAYMTSYKLNFDDKHLSCEVTFKWAPFNKAATGNKREESTDGSGPLPTGIVSATSF